MNSLTSRYSAALVALLLCFGAVAAALSWRTWSQREQETLQQLSHGLAAHIIEHWPEVAAAAAEGSEEHNESATRQALMRMLMTVNPAIQVYMLDAQGRVAAYIGEPGMVRVAQVDLAPVRSFIAGQRLPILGTDPMGSGRSRVFSAAMFPPRAGAGAGAGNAAPPGYLYVVLEGPGRDAVALSLTHTRGWQHLGLALALALLLTLAVAVIVLRRLAQPLRRLAADLRRFELGNTVAATTGIVAQGGNEVAAIALAFQNMSGRIKDQHEQGQRQAAAHREVIANVAHDLRTPLTALHGHLEALGAAPLTADRRERHLGAALTQSNRVRRLVQQLFELATLQALDHLPAHERFRLDELVVDTVQQFGLLPPEHRVTLAGDAPGAVELDGDLPLIERALANLIDNALRHAPGAAPVRVSLRCDEREVSVLVQDSGPGMPADLARRLDAGTPVRDPAIKRHRGGGMGGLGLAIAQRIAALHGGRLHTLATPQGGTTLCLALPRPAARGS